ncbi:MAG: hypothetical protein KDB90_12085 [Planctomycetes bacterium]|nr:hypothetical protein [Planctomycetota bacterium]
MHPALLYLAFRQSAGGLKHRLVRLKQPRYFVPALLAIAYFWLSFGMPGLLSRNTGEATSSRFELYRLFVVPGLAMMMLLGWATAPSRPAPAFTRPEAAQLFVLPLTRRDLVRYRLLRPQMVFVLLGCFFALGALRAPEMSSLYAGIGGFLLLNLASLNAMTAALLANRMKHAGLRGFWLHIPSALLLAVIAVPVAMNFQAMGPIEGGADKWLAPLLTDGLARYTLWPIREIGLVPMATSLSEFGEGLSAVGVLVVAYYVACMLLVAPFEESALELAETTGRKVDAMRSGGGFAALAASRMKKARTTKLKLAPTGPSWRAVLWQTLVAEWRVGPWKLAVGLSGILVLLAAFGERLSHSRATGVFAIGLSAAMGMMLIMMCPRMMATGLHTEMRRLAVWKALPISGYAMLRGKVWAGAILVLVPGVVVLSAAITAALGVAKYDEMVIVLGIFLAAVPLVPALAMMMIGLESAAVLMFPAWLSSMNSEPGFETIGRNLLSLVVRMLGGSLLSIIPGGLFAAIAVVGAMSGQIAPALGTAGLVAAIALVGEMEFVIWLVGKRFDEIDATPE